MSATLTLFFDKLKENGLSIYQFSKNTGIPKNRIYQWSLGRGNPKPEDHAIIVAWLKQVGAIDEQGNAAPGATVQLPTGVKNTAIKLKQLEALGRAHSDILVDLMLKAVPGLDRLDAYQLVEEKMQKYLEVRT